MAYVPANPEEEETQPQPGGTASASGGIIEGTGGASPGPYGGTPSSAPRGTAAPFQNVSSYLAKNRPAVQQLAERVSQKVTERGDAARSAIQQGSAGFGADVASKTVTVDPGLRNQILSDPTALANSPERLAEVTRARQASYTGPRALEDTPFYAPVSQAVNSANTARELLDTTGGRQTLVRSVERGPVVSRGRVLLDEALLSGDPDARARLFGARQSLSDLNERLATASGAAQTQARQAAETTDATRTGVQAALGEATTQSHADLERRLQEARAAAAGRVTAAQGAIPGALRGETVSDQALADLGLTREQLGEVAALPGSQAAEYLAMLGRKTAAGVNDAAARERFRNTFQKRYGKRLLDPTLYDLGNTVQALNPDAEITRGNVATEADFLRQEALNRLSGGQDMFLRQEDRAQAGTAPTDLSTLNQDLLRQIIDAELARSGGKAASQIATNARSGGGTFLKNYGPSIATGGLVPKGGSWKDVLDPAMSLKGAIAGGQNLLEGAANPLDPASVFTESPGDKLRAEAEKAAKMAEIERMLGRAPQALE